MFKYTGRNSRLDEIQAAILDVKLRHLDEDVALRQGVAKRYCNEISNPKIITPAIEEWTAHAFHLFPVRCAERDRLQQYLTEQGVQTIIHYPIPPHKQECYSEMNELTLPITEQIHNEELSLPISPVMTDEEVSKVIEVVNNFA